MKEKMLFLMSLVCNVKAMVTSKNQELRMLHPIGLQARLRAALGSQRSAGTGSNNVFSTPLMLAVTPQRSEDLNLPDKTLRFLTEIWGPINNSHITQNKNIKGMKCATQEGKLYQVLHEICGMTPGFQPERRKPNTSLLPVPRCLCYYAFAYMQTCKLV